MQERVTKIALGDTELELYAGNMALVRFHRAGGDFDIINAGPSAAKTMRQRMLLVDEAAKFLHVNQVGTQHSQDELVNLSAAPEELVEAAYEALGFVPWMTAEDDAAGEAQEEASTDSSMTGHTPSSSSGGTRTDSGASLQESGGSSSNTSIDETKAQE